MSEQAAAPVAGTMPSPVARLEPDAIGVAQDTVIGMASSAPAATVGLSLLTLVTATGYGAGPILLLTAIPMLIIANAYRRLNLWNANCGATFEWVGRAINPYLGYLTGWLMVAAYIIGTVAEVLLLGPSVLAVFGSTSNDTNAYIVIGIAVGIVMLVIAIVGIRITARTQVGMALVEYLILIGLAIAALIWVFGHHPHSVPPTSGWLNPSGVAGLGGTASAGFLAAVFVYGGWDGTLYVNEEVKHRRVNPGRAAIIAVVLLAVIYTLAQVGFQGVLSPHQLSVTSDNGTTLVAVAQKIGGGFWAKAMALSIALSVIATTGTGIVLGSRLVYGMASYRALPGFLSNVSRRFATPVYASIGVGVLIMVFSTVYYLTTSTVQNAFYDVIDVTGFLFSIFYIMTALAAMVYYRRRIFRGVGDFITIGLLPLGAAVFLGWVLVQSMRGVPAVQNWSLVAIIAVGLVLMAIARFAFRSPFFHIRRESDMQES
ncbi:MAG TPA: APC family permease [Streptosporangiaceae bacterium]|nr:APC family permease [Streptosporangiaceae bacterium]